MNSDDGILDITNLGILVGEDLFRNRDQFNQDYLSLKRQLRSIGFSGGDEAIRLALARQEAVRGHISAAQALVQAVCKHGGMGGYQLFVFPSLDTTDATRHRMEMVQQSVGHERLTMVTNTLDNVVRHGIDGYRFKAWLNPLPFASMAGGTEVSLQIRARYASRVYPITTLLHGLSDHRMLHHLFLQFILAETLPCDSFICASHASKYAVQKILDQLSLTFRRMYRSEVTYKGSIDVIPLGVDTSIFKPADKGMCRDHLGLPRDAFIILYLGRLSLLKADLGPFVKVLQSLVVRYPNHKITWIIAGAEDGGYADVVRSYAREAGVAEHTRVMLNISNEVKQILLPAADVFVSPSDSVQESFGLAPLEAMACGVPQVVPDWDGYRDTVVHGRTGFLVPTYWANCSGDLVDSGKLIGWEFDHLLLGQSVAIDLQKSQEYLRQLIENGDLRNEMSVQSRARALRYYSIESVVKRYEELWSERWEIARQVGQPLRTTTLDDPHYYECFGHYPSIRLLDESVLRLTQLGREVTAATELQPQMPKSLPTLLSLDSIVLRSALIKLGGLRCTTIRPEGGPLRMGEVVKLLASECTYHADHIRRHILWLMKYGYIELLKED